MLRIGYFDQGAWTWRISPVACCSPPAAARRHAAGPPGGPGGPGRSRRHRARGAVPGSQQDLAQTAGDRVFFEFDRSDISPKRSRSCSGRRSGCSTIRTSPSPSKAIATSAARANTISRSASAAPTRSRTCWSRAGHTGLAHRHHQLWQGAADRAGLERGGLGAEPRRHHHRQLNLPTEPANRACLRAGPSRLGFTVEWLRPIRRRGTRASCSIDPPASSSIRRIGACPVGQGSRTPFFCPKPALDRER